MAGGEFDEDTRTVMAAIDDAIAASGLSLNRFAAALGTSPARLSSYKNGAVAPSAAFVARANRISKALAYARAQRIPTNYWIADAIDKADARGDDIRTMTLALESRDRLRWVLEDKSDAADAWTLNGRLPKKSRWAALLAGLVAHEFEEKGRAAPEWTRDVKASEPWVCPTMLFTEQQVKDLTPHWLAARNVFIAERDLATV